MTPGYADLPGLMGRMDGDEKHSAAATSPLDVLWVRYDRVLAVDPARAGDPGRDRFLLSKGHGPMACYAVVAAKGFLDPAELDRRAEFGAEISSGSLGHGLPLAVGTALACARTSSTATTPCAAPSPAPPPDRPLAVIARADPKEE